ncbi:hypothetical protein KRMM14A1004_13460 [Krasilnikovia sp. MM14-A1004]
MCFRGDGDNLVALGPKYVADAHVPSKDPALDPPKWTLTSLGLLGPAGHSFPHSLWNVSAVAPGARRPAHLFKYEYN